MKKNINISFFDYTDLFKKNEKDLVNIFRNISSHGSFIMQKELSIFESKLEKFTGVKHAIGVANATDALQLLLKAGGLSQGDEVIFCSHTMVATASAVKFTGATPVPVEAGHDHLIDTISIRRAITKNTKAILPTQLNGRIANMDEITRIAQEYDLQVYEDSAQALGAKYKGKSAGSFGLGGCISFYPAKVLGCFGDGGAVLTNNEEIFNQIKLMRDHGRESDGNVSIWGFNSRLDNLQAAILSFFFDKYTSTIDRRRNIAKHYNERLKDFSSLTLPPAPNSDNDNFDIYQNYEIEAKERDELKVFLSDNGIGTLIQWGGKAVNEFKDLGFSQSLPYTEKMMRRSLMLPLNLAITDDDIDYICDTIGRFYGV